MGGGKAYRWTKRALDVSLSAIALLFTSWLGLIVAVIVRCSSPGPILFPDPAGTGQEAVSDPEVPDHVRAPRSGLGPPDDRAR